MSVFYNGEVIFHRVIFLAEMIYYFRLHSLTGEELSRYSVQRRTCMQGYWKDRHIVPAKSIWAVFADAFSQRIYAWVSFHVVAIMRRR